MLNELKNRTFAAMKRRMRSGAVAFANNSEITGPAAEAVADHVKPTSPASCKEYG
jgi:hypothetical protein